MQQLRESTIINQKLKYANVYPLLLCIFTTVRSLICYWQSVHSSTTDRVCTHLLLTECALIYYWQVCTHLLLTGCALTHLLLTGCTLICYWQGVHSLICYWQVVHSLICYWQGVHSSATNRVYTHLLLTGCALICY